MSEGLKLLEGEYRDAGVENMRRQMERVAELQETGLFNGLEVSGYVTISLHLKGDLKAVKRATKAMEREGARVEVWSEYDMRVPDENRSVVLTLWP